MKQVLFVLVSLVMFGMNVAFSDTLWRPTLTLDNEQVAFLMYDGVYKQHFFYSTYYSNSIKSMVVQIDHYSGGVDRYVNPSDGLSPHASWKMIENNNPKLYAYVKTTLDTLMNAFDYNRNESSGSSVQTGGDDTLTTTSSSTSTTKNYKSSYGGFWLLVDTNDNILGIKVAAYEM